MSEIFDFNGAKGSGWSQPEPMKKDAINTVPRSLRRSALPRWPRASEPELVRHYTWLSQRNFGIDTGFYPLGSCTMKHNPRINERIVQLPGIDRIHPLQPVHQIQGLLSQGMIGDEVLLMQNQVSVSHLQMAESLKYPLIHQF